MAAHDPQQHRSQPCLGVIGKCDSCFCSTTRQLYEQHACRCDNQGLRIGFVLTGGEAWDYPTADDLMALPVPQLEAL